MCTMHCRICIRDWIVNDVTWCGYMLPIHLYSYCTVEAKRSACAVPHGQWITAAHKQRRKFLSWREAICPCWSATGSLHFCKFFREIWQWNQLGAFCNLQFWNQQTCSQDRKPRMVFLLNHPALISTAQWPAIHLPSQDTTPTKNEEYQGIKRYS